jgi:flavin-dependent dehydrogenase
LLKKYPGRVIEKQGGMIPIYDPKAEFCKDNVFLAGDAAGFVKATTGGGIIPGLRSAQALLKSSLNERNYRFKINRSIKQELALNLFLHNAMNNFSESDWNNIVKTLNHGSAKRSFEDINRDNLKKLAASLAIRKPLLAKYALKMIF